jgi:hypothetical protein
LADTFDLLTGEDVYAASSPRRVSECSQATTSVAADPRTQGLCGKPNRSAIGKSPGLFREHTQELSALTAWWVEADVGANRLVTKQREVAGGCGHGHLLGIEEADCRLLLGESTTASVGWVPLKAVRDPETNGCEGTGKGPGITV